MMISSNPWENINAGAEKLVDSKLKYDFFWGVEKNGDYALYINIDKEENTPNQLLNLQDIEIKVFNYDISSYYQWVIILKKKEDWQIFKRLCEDLISVARETKNEKSMVIQVQNRINRWKSLLAQNKNIVFSVEKQMGLITELKFLHDIVATKLSIAKAIQSWVGADADKQDFLLDKSVVEVKSYRTSQGEKVTISSKEQLWTEKEHLYLVTYALTKSESGESVETIANRIKQQLTVNREDELIEIFETKLWSYGYSSLIFKEEQLDSYIVDNTNYYNIIDGFPRITSMQVANEIISLNYKIDLTACKNYQISIEELYF
ncbi:PD-(D/E)XK motif protein [Paenibacillus endoradicis]|uniref:PD-(D/E)XK motif protein n=1 Tax=Paenibacillus endoradicis TaxID=2972487 RepID=UPI0021592CA5|nr:PD-(D/E)XK motif protein [Paenibacillus endoradicis]MCR8657810.1 PD-(D/E)XK motif protein [Paenibacillus endoradicis]